MRFTLKMVGNHVMRDTRISQFARSERYGVIYWAVFNEITLSRFMTRAEAAYIALLDIADGDTDWYWWLRDWCAR